MPAAWLSAIPVSGLSGLFGFEVAAAAGFSDPAAGGGDGDAGLFGDGGGDAAGAEDVGGVGLGDSLVELVGVVAGSGFGPGEWFAQA